MKYEHGKKLLTGSKNERILQALKKAGWYDGRKTDISDVIEYYSKRNITLFPKAAAFFEEFRGIDKGWYVKTENPNFCPDFFFQLFPYPASYSTEVRDYMYDDADYRIPSEDYEGAMAAAGENIVMVGEIGYYYPARVWISDSETLYCTHEYDYDVLKFSTVNELIYHELLSLDLEWIITKK